MINEDVALYIENNTNLVRGEDIFLQFFPEGFDEGIIIKIGRNTRLFYEMQTHNSRILVFKYDYFDSLNLVDTLMDLLNNKRGTLDGTWTITDEIISEDLGVDEQSRYGFSIETQIRRQ